MDSQKHPKHTTEYQLYTIDNYPNIEAWQVWSTLGDDAVPGRLVNTSIHHDRYLYSRVSE